MVEAGTELVGQDLELDVVSHHGDDVLLEHDEALASEPYDMQHALQEVRRCGRVRATLLLGGDELLGEVQRKPENLEEHRGQQGIVVLDGSC